MTSSINCWKTANSVSTQQYQESREKRAHHSKALNSFKEKQSVPYVFTMFTFIVSLDGKYWKRLLLFWPQYPKESSLAWISRGILPFHVALVAKYVLLTTGRYLRVPMQSMLKRIQMYLYFPNKKDVNRPKWNRTSHMKYKHTGH